MAKCKVINGLTAETTKRLVLDAGAFFKNFVFEPDAENTTADTYESAKAAGKLLGATKGGGSFSAVPQFRAAEIDGIRGDVKGLQHIESWEVKMGANIVEASVDILKSALAASNVEEKTELKSTKITGKTCLSDDDYIDNITWVGNLSGSNEPVVIQIYNALNTKGLEMSFADKDEAVIELEFIGHYEMNETSVPPFAIYYPAIEG